MANILEPRVFFKENVRYSVRGGSMGARSPPLKLMKVTFFTMILYNSERTLAVNGDLTAKYY